VAFFVAFLSFRGIGKGHFQGTGTGVQGLADAVVPGHRLCLQGIRGTGIGFAFTISQWVAVNL